MNIYEWKSKQVINCTNIQPGSIPSAMDDKPLLPLQPYVQSAADQTGVGRATEPLPGLPQSFSYHIPQQVRTPLQYLNIVYSRMYSVGTVEYGKV